MNIINKICKTCSRQFEADVREHNRGNAHYCSKSCAAKAPKSANYSHVCKHCGNLFNSASKYSRYCSQSCKLKNYRMKSKDNISMKTFNKIFKTTSCEICNWDITTCDLHHIIPVAQGGKNTLENLICVCPNHHRMIHRNLISKDDLIKIIVNRTISSPNGLLGQDANSGN
jgi:hypothetical protein